MHRGYQFALKKGSLYIDQAIKTRVNRRKGVVLLLNGDDENSSPDESLDLTKSDSRQSQTWTTQGLNSSVISLKKSDNSSSTIIK